ncbi:hypothetical protein DFS33DRAFT_1226769, partial [Desarmillaria ectypa]
DTVTVYCDGACRGNDKSGAIAGAGIWCGHSPCMHPQTMNVETPFTVIEADSKYLISCMVTWLNGFMRSKRKPFENGPIICYLAELHERTHRFGRKAALDYVPEHTVVEGNEEAHLYATEGAYLAEVEEPDWVALRSELD